MVQTIDLYDALAARLHGLTGYPCYYDDVPQKARFPCFYISLDESGQEHVRGERYWRTHDFDILLFPNREGRISDVNRELYRFAPDLLMTLEYIRLATGELLRGTDMTYKKTDGVLAFRVSYDFFLLREREKREAMQTLETKGGVVHDDKE